jgi:hypothetical protein
MRLQLVALLPLLLLTACKEDDPVKMAENKAATGNEQLSSELLGVIDGCNLWLATHHKPGTEQTIYFMKCGGKVDRIQWHEQVGKVHYDRLTITEEGTR